MYPSIQMLSMYILHVFWSVYVSNTAGIFEFRQNYRSSDNNIRVKRYYDTYINN